MFEYQVRTGLPLQVLLNNKDPKPTAEKIPSKRGGFCFNTIPERSEANKVLNGKAFAATTGSAGIWIIKVKPFSV